jgi:hypothetical protein
MKQDRGWLVLMAIGWLVAIAVLVSGGHHV